MDLRLQGQSNGIFYTGYSNEFIECVFEDGDISGRNERYEFRCNADLVCCGRQCCVPQEATIPFWLVIILIVLALLLLLAILGALAWMFAKQKPKPQKPKKKKFVPSAMEEQTLLKPQPVRAIERPEGDISQALVPETIVPEPLQPQKAQIAYYRPFVPDPMEETTFAHPERATASFHDVSEISSATVAEQKVLERPPEKRAELMFTRPGFDNVPSY